MADHLAAVRLEQVDNDPFLKPRTIDYWLEIYGMLGKHWKGFGGKLPNREEFGGWVAQIRAGNHRLSGARGLVWSSRSSTGRSPGI